MVVEGIGLHVKDILVSLVLSIYPGHFGFWPMRKTNTVMYGPRSLGTPFPVIISSMCHEVRTASWPSHVSILAQSCVNAGSVLCQCRLKAVSMLAQ